MSRELRTILNLPNVKNRKITDQTANLGRKFRLKMDGVNNKMRVMTAQASPTKLKPLEGQRLKLIEAFQKTTQQLDTIEPDKADEAIERLLAAIDKVEINAIEAEAGAAAARDEWLEREEEFDDALQQIGELEDADHPKAAALRNLGDAIRCRANDRNYQAALAALDQMLPKLESIYDEHQHGESGDIADDVVAPNDDALREGLTILVTDAESGDPIADARVTVGDQTDVTSEHGLATVELPVGAHDFEARGDGLEGASGQVEIIEGDNPELVIEMSAFSGPREGLTVLVRDVESGEAIEGVDVTVGDQFDVTSSNGLATVELPVGMHRFETSAEHYDLHTGDVEIIEGDNPELVIDLTYSEECEHHEEGSENENGDNEDDDEVAVGGDIHEDDEVNEDDDLTDELADAERFVVLWDEALDDVAGQIERLRTAMEGETDYGTRAVYNGLAQVMDKFPDLDLKYLVADAKAEDQEAYEKTLGKTAREIRQTRELLSNGPLLSTIDENPFVKTTVHATINKVLNEIVDELDIKIKNPRPRLKVAKVKRRTRNLKKIKR